MMAEQAVTLDVRDDLRTGREPLARILKAVKDLAADQELRLLTTFEPVPLYRVLWIKGYVHDARHLADGDWEIVFRRRGRRSKSASPAPTEAPGADSEIGPTPAKGDTWPPPVRHLDNRGLLPPEPMIRILQALEGLSGGQVLAAINDREPMFLFPELEARGHRICVDRRADGVYLTILKAGDGQ